MMLSYMDNTTNPCVDFYQYACGNWEKVHPIPKDKANMDTFEILRENLNKELQKLLSSSIESGGLEKEKRENKIQAKRKREVKHPHKQSEAEVKVKQFYESCMNVELLQERGVQPLLDLLQTLGGWPVLDPNWNADTFNWINVTAQIRKYFNNIFIELWIGPDILLADQYAIQFEQTTLALDLRSHYVLESSLPYLQAYRKYMESVIRLLGASEDRAKQATEEIVEFEIELAKITVPLEAKPNISDSYNKLTIMELHQSIPQIDWTLYLSIILDRPINSSEIVIVIATAYMEDLVVLLSQTDRKTIANYLLWRFVANRISNLDDRFQEADQTFQYAMYGRQKSPPRWKKCVSQINANMGMAVGAMFVRKYFDEKCKENTLSMTTELQQSFREILNTTQWLDEQTIRLAELKVAAMHLQIGYPDNILNETYMNEIYTDVRIDPDKYFENTIGVLRYISHTEVARLGKPVNKTAWDTTPAVVNAFYNRKKNQLSFPAGILQPPMYHRAYPKALNYGGIGVIIGHEVTHGVDDKGKLFDLNGNFRRWWSISAINAFYTRTTCLVAQYSNYTVAEAGIPVDGTITKDENIADGGGIKQAYWAYKKWLHANEHDADLMNKEYLAGINATKKQLFFLGFAQAWCSAVRPEATRSSLKKSVHSPARFRVIGTLSNFDEFSKEYQCELGTPMNPVNKCLVW